MSDETEIIAALRRLPLAVIVVPKEGYYTWECVDGSGSAPSLALALEQAINYMLRVVVLDANSVEAWLDTNIHNN